MEVTAIVEAIRERFPEEVREVREFRGQMSVIVRRDRVKEMLEFLHDTQEICFSHLQDLCGVDYFGKKEPRFEVVYHLYSIRHRNALRVRAEVPEDDPSIESVVAIWDGANWHERECYDMFGITFVGHPDLRRVLMPEDWEGHPLRKNYPLKSDLGDKEWKGFKEVIALAERNRTFETR
jgi:NADH-quinone oxidoreductase subunit C